MIFAEATASFSRGPLYIDRTLPLDEKRFDLLSHTSSRLESFTQGY